jgi:hypothetical protein
MRAGLQGSSGGTFDKNKGQFNKHRRRSECPKCNKWHYDDEKCPTFNRTGGRNDGKGKGPKVNEGSLHDVPEESD